MATKLSIGQQYHSLRFIPDEKDLKNQAGNFNGAHTWYVWHLIPSTRPVINPPAFKSNYINIPGGNGSIDVSTVLTKYPVYDDRTGSIEFYVTRDYDEYSGWQKTYQDIMNYLHGRLFKIILEDDPSYFYRGRLTLNQWKSEKDWSKIVIDYRLEPYKYELLGSWEGESDWTWDEFDFVDGVVPDSEYYQNILVVGEGASTIEEDHEVTKINFDFKNFTMPVSPEVIIIPMASEDGTIPSVQTPSHIVLKQYRKYATHDQVIAKQVYEYTDMLSHAHKPYNIVFRDEEGYIAIEADEGAKFNLSFNYRRGLL